MQPLVLYSSCSSRLRLTSSDSATLLIQHRCSHTLACKCMLEYCSHYIMWDTPPLPWNPAHCVNYHNTYHKIRHQHVITPSHHHTITVSQSHYSSSFIITALAVSLPLLTLFPLQHSVPPLQLHVVKLIGWRRFTRRLCLLLTPERQLREMKAGRERQNRWLQRRKCNIYSIWWTDGGEEVGLADHV